MDQITLAKLKKGDKLKLWSEITAYRQGNPEVHETVRLNDTNGTYEYDGVVKDTESGQLHAVITTNLLGERKTYQVSGENMLSFTLVEEDKYYRRKKNYYPHDTTH